MYLGLTIEQAAVVHDVHSPSRSSAVEQGTTPASLDPKMVLSRLQTIEVLLGIEPSADSVLEDDVTLRPPDTGSPFHGVFTAAAHLKMITRPPQDAKIWSREVIKQLWLS
jgi:hypothetical protein